MEALNIPLLIEDHRIARPMALGSPRIDASVEHEIDVGESDQS